MTGREIFLKKVRSEKLYKNNVKDRDTRIRKKYIGEQLETIKKNAVKLALPGQMISFNYLEPILKEELEYYDAMPVTLFFDIITVDIPGRGRQKRVLGFNIHYYPPKYRFQIIGKIYELFQKYYDKNPEKPMDRKIPGFDYKKILGPLQRYGLAFGVRMYDPKLITELKVIPNDGWSKVVLTEGVFKKKTRDAILLKWKNFKDTKVGRTKKKQPANK